MSASSLQSHFFKITQGFCFLRKTGKIKVQMESFLWESGKGDLNRIQ